MTCVLCKLDPFGKCKFCRERNKFRYGKIHEQISGSDIELGRLSSGLYRLMQNDTLSGYQNQNYQNESNLGNNFYMNKFSPNYSGGNYDKTESSAA